MKNVIKEDVLSKDVFHSSSSYQQISLQRNDFYEFNNKKGS